MHLPLFWKSHCATCSFCTMRLGHAKGLLYWANTNINIGNECSLVKHPTILYFCVLQCLPTQAVLLMLSIQLKAIFQIVCYKQSLLFLCDCGAKRKLWKLGPWWGASICVIPLGQPFPESFSFLETAFPAKNTGSFNDRLGSIICSLLRKMGDDVDSHSRLLRLFSWKFSNSFF